MTCAFLLLASFISPLFGLPTTIHRTPATNANYLIYDATGKTVALKDVVDAMSAQDVVFIGEMHDDATAHQLEAELLQAAVERDGATQGKTQGRHVALSLEMFERDVQLVLDEYLKGLINERLFLASSRPWSNYESDYRPLVEFAREHKVPVLAANAPERYVNRIARLGPDSLAALSPAARIWLAPPPYAQASPPYAAKFKQFMEGAGGIGHGAHGATYLLDAQVLRDATMGDSIAEYLKQHPQSLVLQVNGGFHSEGRLGTPEQLLHYRPNTRLLVVTIIPGNTDAKFDALRVKQLGDFVIVTGSVPSRSF